MTSILGNSLSRQRKFRFFSQKLVCKKFLMKTYGVRIIGVRIIEVRITEDVLFTNSITQQDNSPYSACSPKTHHHFEVTPEQTDALGSGSFWLLKIYPTSFQGIVKMTWSYKRDNHDKGSCSIKSQLNHVQGSTLQKRRCHVNYRTNFFEDASLNGQNQVEAVG